MTINVALASDETYVAHMAATIASILCNTPVQTRLNVYVLSNDLSEKSVERLESLASIRDFNLHVLHVDPQLFDGCPSTRHTVNMYFRLHLPFLLSDQHKVIYFDSDVIVRDSILPLWALDIGEKPFGACEDSLSLIGSPDQKRALRSANGKYYNSGVLVMNLDRMRRDNVEERILTWMRNEVSAGTSLTYPDQDAINALFSDVIFDLPLEWNFQFPLFEHPRFHDVRPKVLHFTTHNKPWKYSASSKYESEYWTYRNLTPWGSATAERGIALWNTIRSLVRPLGSRANLSREHTDLRGRDGNRS
jgi:lipopolysaccharide biosynthesis glycosyltransferase